MRWLAAPASLVLIGAAPAPLFHDPMDDAERWVAQGSDSVAGKSAVVAAPTGRAVELSYDFGGVSGYAFVRRDADLELPPNYEIRFRTRGSGGRNDLQIKLTDGDNVWWKVFPNFRPSSDWQEIVVPAGEIGFAWGPARDKTLRHADGIEFVVARNRDGGAGTLVIDDLTVMPLSGDPIAAEPEGDRTNALVMATAKAAPRGEFPRAFLGEQPYWTLAGSDGGRIAALISEDGAIEPAKGSYSLAPVVIDEGQRFDWANVVQAHRLADGRLPLPTVIWSTASFELKTTLLAEHAGRAAYASYQLTNRTTRKRAMELRLELRPWQVNPPTQFLSQKGGVSPISSITSAVRGLAIVQPVGDGDPPVVRHLTYDGSPSVSVGAVQSRSLKDMRHANLTFAWSVAPNETRTAIVAFDARPDAPSFASAKADTIAHWRGVLGRVTVTVPPARQAIADTLATAVAHILMSRQGAMLKPGTRSYDRAWIRDGAMMSEALMRIGRTDVAREFADWYRMHLFATGKVPCCVDFRGADPVPENDSNGEYIFLVSELYRYTGDRSALESDWPAVLAAARYMDRLRQSERTSAKQALPASRLTFGLMPASISHEGYSAKPQYSLWDDFWALRGYRDAADIAAELGKPESTELAASRDQFAHDLHAAILAARDHWKIAYIPGATSLGDFDATSTTTALDPGNEQARLDPNMLRSTFERYWVEFRRRATDRHDWIDYTPYEMRTIGSLVRLGWRDRIDALFDFFMADRRPAGWNQWAEVVGRKPRDARFIGDMPHAWVASDFIRSALDLFAWDRRDDRALVLGGGLSADWLSGEGSAIHGLATPYGSLNFAIRGTARRLSASISGSARPPGGFILAWPFAGPPPPARVDGRVQAWHRGALRIRPTGRPVTIEIGPTNRRDKE